jgi:hypothetical protein
MRDECFAQAAPAPTVARSIGVGTCRPKQNFAQNFALSYVERNCRAQNHLGYNLWRVAWKLGSYRPARRVSSIASVLFRHV